MTTKEFNENELRKEILSKYKEIVGGLDDKN